MAWTTLCELSELTEAEGKQVSIDGYRLAVFLHEGKPHVMDDTCPHAGASMAGGWIDDGCAVCPWHGWAFRVTDGAIRGSETVGIRVYPVRVHEFQGRQLVQVDLPMA